MSGDMEYNTNMKDYKGEKADKALIQKPKNHLASTGGVDYGTSTKDYKGEQARKSSIQRPKNNLAASGDVDYVTNTKEYAGQQADKSEMQKPKNHLASTGDIDFQTNNTENFQKLSLHREKVEKVNRDNLATAKDKIQTVTTSKDYKNYDSRSPSDLRATPSWYISPRPSPITIS